MTNYEKAEVLLSLGYASKVDKTRGLMFNLGCSAFGFIYPNDINVHIVIDNDNNTDFDEGAIDIDRMLIIGTKGNYNIEKYWHKQGTEEQLFPIFFYI